MVMLNRIYTRTGDDGTTALGSGSRISKTAARVEAYGTVDETNAAIGLARTLLAPTETLLAQMLARIQNDLFDLGADLCRPGTDFDSPMALRIHDRQVERLEREIDAMNATLKPLNSFVLPGGTAAAAHLHHARTVSRRAEREITALAVKEPVSPAAVRYINRLSDHLFVAARYVNDGGALDVLWTPGGTRTG